MPDLNKPRDLAGLDGPRRRQAAELAVPEQLNMANELAENSDYLNDWEIGFIDDILAKNLHKGIPLTDGQAEKLDTIYEERIVNNEDPHYWIDGGFNDFDVF